MARYRYIWRLSASMRDVVDVLLLTTYDTDGAGKFAHQLADSVGGLGYSTRVICVQNRSEDVKTFGLIDNSWIQKIQYRLVEEFYRRAVRPRPEYAFIHMQALPDKLVLGSSVWPDACNMIICTFLSGMISPAALTEIYRRYGQPRIIFYGVDMNLYTAGCHYAQDCIGYMRECQNCPAVPWFARKKVHRAFREKRGCYAALTPVVVASSHEQHEQLSKSSLLKNARIEKILMAVDEQLFGKHEATRSALKRRYGIGGRTILIRSSSEPRKGCERFVQAIRKISRELPEILSNTTIVAIGDQFIASQLNGLNVKVFSPGYIADEGRLSEIYSLADVFLMTSTADSGPVMLAQSLMSGTPVISTDVGLARDLICSGRNGEILDNTNGEALVEGIVRFLRKTDDELGLMRRNARELAHGKFSKVIYTEQLKKLVRGC